MREGYYTLCGGIYVTSQLYKEHGCNDKKKSYYEGLNKFIFD